jgi:hypothetical protein
MVLIIFILCIIVLALIVTIVYMATNMKKTQARMDVLRKDELRKRDELQKRDELRKRDAAKESKRRSIELHTYTNNKLQLYKKATLLSDFEMKSVYQVLADFDSLCQLYGVDYWVVGGSMLAIERGGETHIPWDDDLDISVTVEGLRKLYSPELQRHMFYMGYFMADQRRSPTMTCFLKFQPIPYIYRNYTPRVYIDLFAVYEFGEELYHPQLDAHGGMGIHRWLKSDVFPIRRVKYGPVYTNCANNIRHHLTVNKGHLKLKDIDTIRVFYNHDPIRRSVQEYCRDVKQTVDYKELENEYAAKKFHVDVIGTLPTHDQWINWLSLYFTFQWVPDKKLYHSRFWNPPVFVERVECPRTSIVKNGLEAAKVLKTLCDKRCAMLPPCEIGILLSSGIDSGSVAYCTPKGAHAFFVRYIDVETPEPVHIARKYATDNGLHFHIVDITWDDYIEHTVELMRQKKSPLHPVEVPLYVVFQEAHDMGIKLMLSGWGCDTYFGGMDKLLSKTYPTWQHFKERYTFLDPTKVLMTANMPLVDSFFEKKEPFATQRFLDDNYHGMTMQCFFYLAGLVNMSFYCPWGEIGLKDGYDLARVLAGEPKYIVQEAFTKLSNGVDVTEKLPFTRPDYIKYPENISCPYFRDDIDYNVLSKQQKWMLFMASCYYEISMDRYKTVCSAFCSGDDISKLRITRHTSKMTQMFYRRPNYL